MHEPFTEELIPARFTFLPERAEEFLAQKDENDNWVYTGQLVTQMEFETVEEVMAYARQFEDALDNVIAVIGKRVVCLSGEVYNSKTNEDIEDETGEEEEN